MDMIYRLMTEQDCQEVAALLQANAQSQNGGLLGEFPIDKVKTMYENAAAVVIAQTEKTLVAVVFSFNITSPALPPICKTILKHCVAQLSNSWFYGPVCIAAQFRGKNILSSLYQEICAQNIGKPVAFINSDNERSLRAHHKLGMRNINQIQFNNTSYIVVQGL